MKAESNPDLEIWERPVAEEMYMLSGWRQWADAGSVSSGLVSYLIQRNHARPIGQLRPEGFYLFQIPGTHDLVRPEIRHQDGYPEILNTPRNEFFFTGDEKLGLVLFLGDEPQLDAERYSRAFLDAAEAFQIKRIVGLGGVYGELPYEKERMVSAIYSLPGMKDEINQYAVNLSNYHGGASIESYICKRAGERSQEFTAFYAFVPTYDFSGLVQVDKSIRIENDFMAWLGVMRRIVYMLQLDFDLTDLETKSQHLIDLMDSEIEEIQKSSNVDLRAYMSKLTEDFTENPFIPQDKFWEEKLKGLFDRIDPEEPEE
jgi:hypothetical protein